MNETGANGGSGKINGEEVLGTGWLFDYATNAPAGQWIGYFATNLHVANALMRADDNPKYAYTGEGQTDQFFLGKYDDSGGSLSSGQDDVTYVQLKNLPKTQFAAVDFGGVGSGKYADFAVLQITLQTGSGVGPVLGSANAEAQAYTDWIEPSVAALKQISTAGDSASLFYAAETDASYLEGQRAFVAGYPGVDGAKALYYRQQTGNQWNLENYGEWTVNVPDGSSQTGGQAFDTGETSSWGGYLGLYAADYYTNATTTYHGKKYQMGGVGAVIHRSNLGEGSSGSMVMSAAKQVLGIYFGTIGTAEGDPESDYGLMQLLVVPKALAQSLQSNFYGLAADVGPYDLIAGANGSASYKDSLGTTATWLFPAAS